MKVKKQNSQISQRWRKGCIRETDCKGSVAPWALLLSCTWGDCTRWGGVFSVGNSCVSNPRCEASQKWRKRRRPGSRVSHWWRERRAFSRQRFLRCPGLLLSPPVFPSPAWGLSSRGRSANTIIDEGKGIVHVPRRWRIDSSLKEINFLNPCAAPGPIQ